MTDTNILQTRALIVSRLNTIRALPKQQAYSAMELHGNNLDRQQRKSNTIYQQKLRLHEKRLKYDLAVIDNYLSTSTLLPTVEGAPLIPAPTSMWVNVPLPVRQLTRKMSRPRTRRRIR